MLLARAKLTVGSFSVGINYLNYVYTFSPFLKQVRNIFMDFLLCIFVNGDVYRFFNRQKLAARLNFSENCVRVL